MSVEAVPPVFLGRKTRRQNSEQRRLNILRAALYIAAQDGVRAIRHRIVAQQAEVPLSATTYYFKDIHDLITDAFVLFSHEAKAMYIDPFWTQAVSRLEQERARSENSFDVCEWLCLDVAHHGAQYIVKVVQENRLYLQTEMAFLDAALHDERLRAAALDYLDHTLQGMRWLMGELGVKEPELLAKGFFSLVRRIMLEAMLGRAEALDPETVEHELCCYLRSACARSGL